jgi:hypothetical protein
LPSSGELSPAEIVQGRQRVLDAILTTDPPGTARAIRLDCAFRDDPADVAKARAEGKVTAPDAGDSCVAALTRQAHDGALIALYQDILRRDRPDREPTAVGREALLSRLQGMAAAQSPDGDPDAARLPQRIVAALGDGSNRLDLGAGHVVTVTPGLAFDVGFASAYWAGEGAHPATITDRARFKGMTEACVGQRADTKLCFSVGYVHGAAAFATAQRSASR